MQPTYRATCTNTGGSPLVQMSIQQLASGLCKRLIIPVIHASVAPAAGRQGQRRRGAAGRPVRLRRSLRAVVLARGGHRPAALPAIHDRWLPQLVAEAVPRGRLHTCHCAPQIAMTSRLPPAHLSIYLGSSGAWASPQKLTASAVWSPHREPQCRWHGLLGNGAQSRCTALVSCMLPLIAAAHIYTAAYPARLPCSSSSLRPLWVRALKRTFPACAVQVIQLRQPQLQRSRR
jgi:hypothetical protein